MAIQISGTADSNPSTESARIYALCENRSTAIVLKNQYVAVDFETLAVVKAPGPPSARKCIRFTPSDRPGNEVYEASAGNPSSSNRKTSWAVFGKNSELPLQRLRRESKVIVFINLYDPIGVRACDINT